jgi:hypothetical protein
MSIPAGGRAFVCARYRHEQAFDPEAMHAMGIAFDGARWALGGAADTEESARRLAELIVELATAGERNPWRLRAGALRNFA